VSDTEITEGNLYEMRSDQPVLREWSVVLFTFVESSRVPNLRMLFNVSFLVQIAVSTYAQLSAVTSLRAFDVHTWLLSKILQYVCFIILCK
jgi:hypothetical protein